MNFLCWLIDEWRMIRDILNIRKSHPSRSFGPLYYMFHCFNISRHISISVQFFIISVSSFAGFFCWIFENNCPGGGVLVRFFCPRGRDFALSLCPGGREFALSKISPGGCPGGGWSGLELTDTLDISSE